MNPRDTKFTRNLPTNLANEMNPYEPAFERGSKVRVASREVLETFSRKWKFHNALKLEQLVYAGQSATVAWVGIYHGGDVIYQLSEMPGVWHGECLGPAEG